MINTFFRENLNHLLKILVLIISIGFGWYLLRGSHFGELINDHEWMKIKINETSFWGPLIFIFIGSVSTIFGFPRIVICVISGFVFGALTGFFVALLTTIIGCIETFYYSKFLGREVIEKKLPKKMKRYEKLLVDNSFLITLVIRFLPVGNNTLTNLLAGVSPVKATSFFLASFIGYVPMTIIFSLVGSGVREDALINTLAAVLLFLLSALVTAILLIKIKKEHKIVLKGTTGGYDV